RGATKQLGHGQRSIRRNGDGGLASRATAWFVNARVAVRWRSHPSNFSDRRPITQIFLGILPRVSAIGFATSIKTLLKGAKTVAVVGPASSFKQRTLPKLLGKKLDGLLLELAR